VLEERTVLALVELDHGGSGFCVIFGHRSASLMNDRIGTGRNGAESEGRETEVYA